MDGNASAFYGWRKSSDDSEVAHGASGASWVVRERRVSRGSHHHEVFAQFSAGPGHAEQVVVQAPTLAVAMAGAHTWAVSRGAPPRREPWVTQAKCPRAHRVVAAAEGEFRRLVGYLNPASLAELLGGTEYDPRAWPFARALAASLVPWGDTPANLVFFAAALRMVPRAMQVDARLAEDLRAFDDVCISALADTIADEKHTHDHGVVAGYHRLCEEVLIRIGNMQRRAEAEA